MPLKLIPPGTRKGNKFYLILGMEAGTQYEVSTRTADKRLAQRRLVELREKILAAVPAGGQAHHVRAGGGTLQRISPAQAPRAEATR